MRIGGTLFARLRIGEKIGLSFGLVGLLFIGVILAYHRTLTGALDHYQELQTVHQAKSDRAREIAMNLLRASDAEKSFLLHRQEAAIAEANREIDRLLERTEQLRGIDAQGAQAAALISDLAGSYRESLKAIADAWRVKGLDHNTGLQGAFRDTAHRLQEMAAGYQIGPIYIDLLQIRRSEKDLGLRHEEHYRARVGHLIEGLGSKIEVSAMPTEAKTQMLAVLDAYRDAFGRFADKALADEDIGGGKGPFRDEAHRLEDLIQRQYVPGMEVSVLELRRREEDYLLRLDPRYVGMVEEELAALRGQVGASLVAEPEKAALLGMLTSYERDFRALVDQNARVEELTARMNEAAERIFAVVETTVSAATQAADKVAAEVQAGAARDTRIMLWIVAVAALLGILFSVLITRWITRPVLQMAGLLDQLALEDSIERIDTVPGSRDEINAMAESLNQMAEHKRRLFAWWKASLAEMSNAGGDTSAVPERAREPLRQTLLAEIEGLGREIAAQSDLLAAAPAGEWRDPASRLAKAARTLSQRVEILRH